MPHICGDEVMAFILAFPAVGYCWYCIKMKFKRMTKKAGY